jgi:phospholipid transport system substrate-binding protein
MSNRSDSLRWAPYLLALLWCVPFFSLAQAQAKPAPYEQVIMDATQRLIDGLRLQQQAIKKDPQIAYRLVENTVLPHLDFDRIARWVLGKHWRTATPEQQKAFTREFTAFLTRTYVTAMVTYTDAIIANANGLSYPPGNKQLSDDQAQVRARIRMTNGNTVDVVYKLTNASGAWKVYDLTIEGISLAITYRSNINSEIAKRGLDGLIAHLAQRNREEDPLKKTDL